MGERAGGMDTVKQVPPIHAPDHEPGGPDPLNLARHVGQWCRVWLNHDQTVPAADPGGARNTVEFDEVINPYPAYFGTAVAIPGGDHSAITILQPGVYAATYRLYLSGKPDVSFTTELNGIDWDEWLYYERTHDPVALTGWGVHDTYTFRSDPTYGDEPPRVYVIAGNREDATDDLVIDASRSTSTYLEVIRISAAEITGNPDDAV